MLMLMTAPLAFAFLVYHIYLIWAGMTTNESAKWSDWQDDVAEGLTFKLIGAHRESESPFPESPETTSSWPTRSDQVLVRTKGEPPREGHGVHQRSNDIVQPDNPDAAIDQSFVRVQSMRDIDNVYDLGFWRNLSHVFGTYSEQRIHIK